MSLSWVQAALQMTNEQLGITEEERQAFEKEKAKFCGIADNMVKEKINPKITAHDLFEKLEPEQQRDFIQDALQAGFEFLGLRKKRITNDDQSIAERQGQEFLKANAH